MTEEALTLLWLLQQVQETEPLESLEASMLIAPGCSLPFLVLLKDKVEGEVVAAERD